MSGSGGYYKYRCKYWLTYNCGNWVWVNNAPCANCLAEGRDSDIRMAATPFRLSREVYVPQLENGFIQYNIMDIIAASDADSGWAVKDMPAQPFPTVTGPSVINIATMDGIDTQRVSKNGFQLAVDRESWTGGGVNME